MAMSASQLLDARLTPLGLSQARALNSFLKAHPEVVSPAIEAVASSPLSRTLATSSIVFDGVGDPAFAALESVRERTSTPRAVSGDGRAFLSEKRRDLTELTKEFPRFDFEGLSESDELWTESGESRGQAAVRAEAALHWIWECPHETLAVVTHGGCAQTSPRPLSTKCLTQAVAAQI